MNVSVNLTPEGAKNLRFVQILNHNNFRSFGLADIAAILLPGIGSVSFMPGFARFDEQRHGVADHRPHMWHEIPRLFEVEPIPTWIMAGNLFPTVVDGWGIPAFELE